MTETTRSNKQSEVFMWHASDAGLCLIEGHHQA
jgi:hypothetical protein